MISTNLVGGICNRMFQIAAIEDMGRRLGVPTYYNDIDRDIERLSRAAFWAAHAREYLTIFKNLDWRKNQNIAVPPTKTVHVPFGYTDVKLEDNVRYEGYFQSEKYFDKDFIINLFQPSGRVVERLARYKGMFDGNTCSIHVRRNNYLLLSHIHTVLPLSYYSHAIRMMDTIGVEKYFVFSDDLEWCYENFVGDCFTFVSDTDYIEMYLMGQCANNIIANSTFSWWGAYLNPHPNKKVIAPLNWFADKKMDSSNIVPDGWVKI
jgi:hypothetical protein